ncbi:MAG: hypothetical protein JWR04_1671 [Rhodoglobus sp.]|nr:hypothetical protein [Rhodoglobus sp.]
MSRPPLRADLTAFARLTGWGYFPVAFVGRLPFAMMIVGVLTLVVSVRGSIAEAGLAAACTGIGTAVCGPTAGALADRFSQRAVLLACCGLSVLSVAGLLALLAAGAPIAVVVLLAFLVGGTTPQVAPFSRARLAGVASTPRSEGTRARAMTAVMSYESVADEASFVLGPVLVGLLTTLVAPWAPLLFGAALSCTVVVAFALHPSASAALPREVSGLPSAPLVSPRVVVLAFAMLLVGGIFGSVLTALSEFMSLRGAGEQTGIAYGAMSLGAILAAIVVALLPSGFGLVPRWAACAVLGLGGAGVLAAASSVPLAVVGLFVAGAGIGAVLVVLFSLGARSAPEGRATTVLTTLQSALVVGQALATAACGLLVQHAGATAGYLVAGALAALLAVLALVSGKRFR